MHASAKLKNFYFWTNQTQGESQIGRMHRFFSCFFLDGEAVATSQNNELSALSLLRWYI
jgi:hypothetical protein